MTSSAVPFPDDKEERDVIEALEYALKVGEDWWAGYEQERYSTNFDLFTMIIHIFESASFDCMRGH